MALDIAPPDTIIDSSQVDGGGGDDGSLAEHEAQFKRGQSPVETPEDGEAEPASDERDKSGRFRHRSQSQRATPEDVAEINALTKTLREKEAELAKVKPDALNGSPRVLTLKQRIKAIESDLAELNAPKAVEKPKEAAPSAPTTFDETEPTIDQFASEADPYAAMLRAQVAYDARKAAHESKQKATVEAQQAAQKAEIEAYQGHTATYAKTKPDFDAVTSALVASQLPPLLVASIIKSADKGPAFVYYLAQHQDALDELVLLTDGKPVTDAFVATVQRRLKQQAQTVQATGSVAPVPPSYIPPRPPNPVRTGPIRTGDDLPGDDASLAEHEKAYGRKRR